MTLDRPTPVHHDPIMTELDIDAAVAALTLEEKASLCSGSDFWHTEGIERAGVSPLLLSDGPHGLRKQAAAADHVGLGESVPATCFPPAVGARLVLEPGAGPDESARPSAPRRALRESSVVLGPGINIKRSPLCGRNFEYFSEDPLRGRRTRRGAGRGIQRAGRRRVASSTSRRTTRRPTGMRVSAEVDERTLREIYLPAFERVVTHGASRGR